MTRTQEAEPNPHLLRTLGIAVLTFLVLSVMTWVGISLRENTRTNIETHDQVLTNTLKLNQLQQSQEELGSLHDTVQGLEYRVGNLEKRQAKDDQFREKHGSSGL